MLIVQKKNKRNKATFKKFLENSAFLKIAVQTFEVGYILNISLKF